MGVVELVLRREGRFERLYARKRLHVHFRQDAALRAMFMDEARLAGAVQHPNVLSVLDVGEDEDGPYLIMEYVDGVPLSALVKEAQRRGQMLPLQICVRIAADVARGLHAAHEARGPDGMPLGLVHRDVSASNVLIGFDGAVRVTDFGIAKAIGNFTHTSIGVLKGNRAYLSPEQLRFETIDRRSDLFSLGVVVYELLAGHQLYGGDSAELAARRVLTEPPPDIAEERTDVPTELSELLFELLAKDRDARPATAGEVAARLDRIAAQIAADEDEVIDIGAFIADDFTELRDSRRTEISTQLSTRKPATEAGATPAPVAPGPARRRPRLLLVLPAAMALAAAVGGALWWQARRQAVVGPGSGRGLAVWAGGWHTCAADSDELWCWGKNSDGQLGDWTTTDRVVPTQVRFEGRPASLALGHFHTCGCTASGQTLCWGRNDEGQLGNGTTTAAVVPTPVPGAGGCERVTAGASHTCALARGRVRCWGANARGQLGLPGEPSRLVPAEIPGIDDAVAVAAGDAFSCVLRATGAVLCFGDNKWAQLGRGDQGGSHPEPAPVRGVSDAVEVALGSNTACARQRSGSVLCWGQHGDQKAGSPYVPVATPTALKGVTDAEQITLGNTHMCVRRAGGKLACLWSNHFGQIGDGSVGQFLNEPAAPVGLQRVFHAAAGQIHVCGVHDQGLSCWGGNFTGQIGDGTTKQRTRPVSVVGWSH